MRPLPPSFYDRDALDVAMDVIGCELEVGPVRVRITEVEAYRFPGDTANHARMGKTPRNTPMWGPPGHAYVYLCYGLHPMLNFVTGPEGHAAAVLIRGAEPVDGVEHVRARRNGIDGPAMLDGPGKLGQGLALTTAMSGSPLDGAIRVFARREAYPLLVGPRIGIDYASPEDRAAPWRIAMAGSRWVGQRKKLAPI
jgi:DNA-3-methyladenine glycosylase